MNKEIEKQLIKIMKALKVELKASTQQQAEAHKNYDIVDYFVKSGVCEGLERAIAKIEIEFNL